MSKEILQIIIRTQTEISQVAEDTKQKIQRILEIEYDKESRLVNGLGGYRTTLNWKLISNVDKKKREEYAQIKDNSNKILEHLNFIIETSTNIINYIQRILQNEKLDDVINFQNPEENSWISNLKKELIKQMTDFEAINKFLGNFLKFENDFAKGVINITTNLEIIATYLTFIQQQPFQNQEIKLGYFEFLKSEVKKFIDKNITDLNYMGGFILIHELLTKEIFSQLPSKDNLSSLTDEKYNEFLNLISQIYIDLEKELAIKYFKINSELSTKWEKNNLGVKQINNITQDSKNYLTNLLMEYLKNKLKTKINDKSTKKKLKEIKSLNEFVNFLSNDMLNMPEKEKFRLFGRGKEETEPPVSYDEILNGSNQQQPNRPSENNIRNNQSKSGLTASNESNSNQFETERGNNEQSSFENSISDAKTSPITRKRKNTKINFKIKEILIKSGDLFNRNDTILTAINNVINIFDHNFSNDEQFLNILNGFEKYLNQKAEEIKSYLRENRLSIEELQNMLFNDFQNLNNNETFNQVPNFSPRPKEDRQPRNESQDNQAIKPNTTKSEKKGFLKGLIDRLKPSKNSNIDKSVEPKVNAPKKPLYGFDEPSRESLSSQRAKEIRDELDELRAKGNLQK